MYRFLKMIGIKRTFKLLKVKDFPPHLAVLFNPEKAAKDAEAKAGPQTPFSDIDSCL